ncbi:PEP-CTERM sorting domain-containing protein [Rhodoferax sp. GW822-FHT02A01]|uniref:PEP-CTERM sorting domain-containing protein n=1 Tax=Rhodoferax sp. GW822-FHT02A01 TaxID=3141537 RepID=UPI00315CE599
MTKSAFQLKVLAGLLLVIAGSASAATYTNVPGGATTGLPFAYFGNAANPSGDSPKVGEVFSLTSAETLSSFSFYALGNVAASLQLNVAQWNPTTIAAGTPLLTTSGSAVETFNSTGGYTTISFDNLGLNLNSGTSYIAYLTSSDPSVTGIQLSRIAKTADTTGFGTAEAHYSTVSNSWVLGPNNGFLNLQYTAITAAVPEPESYALLLAGMGLIGAVVKRRKAKQA